MRRSRGYILTEIMMSMLLQAMFIVVLSGAFYMMLTFYTKTQQLQTARMRGQRVISYIDQRIRHAGLGLWQCKTADQARTMAGYLPVSLDGGGSVGSVISGDTLMLLYAYQDFDSSASNSFILDEDKPISHTPPNRLIENYYAVEGLGLPFYSGDALNFSADPVNSTDIVNPITTAYAGSELLHLQYEKMLVDKNMPIEERSFYFTFPDSDPDQNHKYYHVAGILDIYMKLNKDTKIFDLYVLSTGGKDSPHTGRGKPTTWPGSEATWTDNNYGEQVFYVSRASWKLHNIKDFKF